MATNDVLIMLLLYIFLPLWGIAGFADWCCHRASRIEATSGLQESLVHSLMGLQVGIPILLCLLYQVNVLVLLICIVAWLMHELVAHWDVHYAEPRRRISIWEMHAHNYLASLPLYMLGMIIALNAQVALDLVSLNWSGQLQLVPLAKPHGGEGYLPFYLGFMAMLAILPYAEENLRCLRHALKHRAPSS